jgi:hypothetical protein
LGSNILCERHNHALSRLDRTAIRVFSALRRYQRDQLDQPDPHGNEFYLASGEDLERWLLKAFWGATAAGVVAVQGQRITEIRTSVDRHMLAGYLFRDGSLPDGWGMYIEGDPKDQFSAEAEIALSSQSGPDGALWRGDAAMGVVNFGFLLGIPQAGPGRELIHRPDGIVLNDQDHAERRSAAIQKVLALSWDRSAGNTVTFTFTGRRSVKPPGS